MLMASFGQKLVILLLFALSAFTYAVATSPSSRSLSAKQKVYIAYLGEKKHDDPQLTVESHLDLLRTVVGSKEEASKLMVHNYKYGFSGFSAKLTKAQSRKLAASPGVIHLIPDHAYKLQGTRAPVYLGLTDRHPDNIIHKTNKGDGIIIGLIDTGIWGNNSRGIFSDKGYGPIPARWKGTCASHGVFVASQQCNKKIIGAYWHREGATANGFAPGDNIGNDETSPLDFDGHGTHCASTAAGSKVRNVTYLEQFYGTFRGIAPRACLAIYKACFRLKDTTKKDDDCLWSDVVDAFDRAIHDGVDVISASIGPHMTDSNDTNNYLNFASYHAVARGITVVTAAGNLGPSYTSMANTSPWHITVAAARIDEEIVASITLGNNITVMSVPISGTHELGFKKLVSLDNSDLKSWKLPDNNDTLSKMVNGTVVFFPEYSFNRSIDYKYEFTNVKNLYESAKKLGAVGLVVDIQTTSKLSYKFQDVDSVVYLVERKIAEKIKEYARLSASPMVNLGKPILKVGNAVRTIIDSYSSRGPSLRTSTILKPDIAAPGSNLLGAASEKSSPGGPRPDNGFVMMSGTSASTPVVAGLVALLKAAHPQWSPAAIKSALVTTASNTDIYGAPITSPWSKSGIAGPLDLGGGIANVNAASDPGLIYDMQPSDYVNYLCGAGYGIKAIKYITGDQRVVCLNQKEAVMDVNLPSIGVSGLVQGLVDTLTIRRIVTNVGPERSSYKAQIIPPVGTEISVSPDLLLFDAQHKQITYYLTIKKWQNVETFADGSLTWTDGVHHVRSPIVVLS